MTSNAAQPITMHLASRRRSLPSMAREDLKVLAQSVIMRLTPSISNLRDWIWRREYPHLTVPPGDWSAVTSEAMSDR
jgi:hypothetical protein